MAVSPSNKKVTSSASGSGGHKVRINTQITAYEVRLVDPKGVLKDLYGNPDPAQAGVMSRERALEKARMANLDLVEISPTASPPVVQVMDFGKYLFEEKKNRKKQPVVKVKEIKMRPVTDEGDYQVKLRNLIAFLQHGDKVKVTLRFRGREIAHHDLGLELLKRIEADTLAVGTVEQMPKLEGRQFVMSIAPKKGVTPMKQTKVLPTESEG